MTLVIPNIIKRLLFAIAVLLAVLLAGNALTYISFDSHYGFLRLKQEAIKTGWYLPFYYSHVLVAGLILVIGLFQLHPVSRTVLKQGHKWLGYFYVFGILFFAAPGGLVMSFFIGRGPVVLASFILQTVLWFIFTAIAFRKILHGDIISHKGWMWRSYALTFAAVTLRLYIFIFSNWFNMADPAAYGILSWSSWLPNLVITELLIAKSFKPDRDTSFSFLKSNP